MGSPKIREAARLQPQRSVTRIERLTAAQIGQMPEWTEMYIRRGLATGEADWAQFAQGARSCYRFTRLEWPGDPIRVQSPIVGSIAASIAARILTNANSSTSAVHSAVHSAVDSAVYSAVCSAVDSAVRSAVDSAVRSAVYSAVRSAVDSAVYSAVHSAVDSAVRSAVDSAVRSAVYSAVRSAVDSAVHSAVDSAVYSAGKLSWHYWMGGQFWIGWQAFDGFFRHVCGLRLPGDLDERAEAYERAETAVCYWWANKFFVMVCNRPTAIRRDERGRLHSEDRKSIEWPDGWGLYSIHGVTVPAKYVTTSNSEIDPADVLREPNAQVRMAIISKIGFGRILGQLPHKRISVAPNPRHPARQNELIEFDLGNDQLIRGLRVWWLEKSGGERETIIPVWRTRAQFGDDCPDNIDDTEQVRRWVMRLPKNAQIAEEM